MISAVESKAIPTHPRCFCRPPVHSAAIPSLEGLVVIDVVEGTAISSLPFMESVLRGRPLRFETLQQAADWALATGGCSAVALRAMGPPSFHLTKVPPFVLHARCHERGTCRSELGVK